MYRLFRLLCALLLALASSIVRADADHDHAPAASGLPRFAAVSESFELVGVLDGSALTVWLDRFDDNRPVKGAIVKLELGGAKITLKPTGDGQFSASLAQRPPPGVLAVTAMVTAGEESDLLSGELDLHQHEDVAAHRHGWREWAPWILAGIAVLGLAAWLALHRRRSTLLPLLLMMMFLLPQGKSEAADDHGHDHGGAPARANPNAPQRLPDGSVFLPKPAQRQIEVRTMVAKAEPLARAVELSGKIVMDPNAGGRVQAMTAGRIEPGAKGLPGAGQRVAKGEVLAYVVPAIAPAERASQAAAVAELRAAKSLAEKHLARLKELVDTVPRKEIEAAESEVASLGERVEALQGGISGREALVAPVSGVIASSNAVAGQVVDSRDLVFEIVDPRRLRVEALAYEPAIARDIAGASLAGGSESVRLEFVGAAQALREQALPLVFRGDGEALSRFALGQPVKVVVQTKSRVEGVAVPAAALARDPSNRAIVWVKTAPERFAPRPVVTQPLDGLRVAATSGLQAGDRVVVRGASLVNQVR